MARHEAPQVPRGRPAAKKPRSGRRPAAYVKVNKAAKKPRSGRRPPARKQMLDVDRDSLTNPPKPKARPKPTRKATPTKKSTGSNFHDPLDAETEAFWRDNPSAATRKQKLDVDLDSLPPSFLLPKPNLTTPAKTTKPAKTTPAKEPAAATAQPVPVLKQS